MLKPFDNKLKKICLIGAPGAGKSTLYGFLINARAGNRHWITPREAKIEIAKRHCVSCKVNRFKNRFLALLLTSALFRKYACMIADYALADLKEECFEKLRLEYAPLLDIAWNGLSMDINDPVTRMRASEYFLKVAKDEALMDRHMINRTILCDDSIWQSMRNVNNYFKDTNKKMISELPKPYAVICCFTDSEQIYRQIKQRKGKGRINTCHSMLSDEELFRSIEMDIENARFKVQLLESAGVAVLNINSENDLYSKISSANDFISSIQ